MLQVNLPGARRPAPRAVRPALRRALAGAAASAAVLVSLSAAPASYALGVPPGGHPTAGRPTADHLVVTVRDAGEGADGTYELYCRPGGGSHPDPAGACAAVDRNTRWGEDAFAPVPRDAVCTLQHGGPATARVTGTWAGRPVDAAFDRGDGCGIARWDRFVPLLPEVRSAGRR